MASLAESSVGSVSIHHLEALRKQMLGHAQAHQSMSTRSETDIQAPQLQEDYAFSALPAADETTRPVEIAVIPQSQDAYRTPSSSPLRRAPYRIPSASAPMQEMDSLLDATPSQKAFRVLTKAASFHAYPDGDTQPMESQVYRGFNESMSQKPKDPISDKVPDAVIRSPNSLDAATTTRSPGTCQEGDTGYIDLDRAFQPGSPSSTAAFDDLLASPQTQIPVTALDEHRPEFAMPETPAVAGRKHGRDGELLTSATTAATTARKTPAFSQLFGMPRNGAVMSATQLFNQTQAPSSPVPDQLRSDPVVSRPSPLMAVPREVSSPTDAFSSPMLTTSMRPPTMDEPQGNYTSMRESQERRAARLRQELGRRSKGGDDFWNHEEDSEGEDKRGHGAERRMRRVMSDQTIIGLKRPGAGARPHSRPSSANDNIPSTIKLTETPAMARRGERIEFDDGFLDDVSQDEEKHSNHRGTDDEANDNDEYDELGQTLRSQANDDNDNSSSPARIEHHGAETEGDAVADIAAPEQSTDLTLHQSRPTATQHSAIADSQPATQERRERPSSSHVTHHSSSASFVPGSQYIGKTSEDQARRAASQYRKTPSRHPPAKIPSSPPLPRLLDSTAEDMSASHDRDVAQKHSEHHDRTNVEVEVPESDLPELPALCPTGSTSQGYSNSVPRFSTAQTHASGHSISPLRSSHNPGPSPLKSFNSQQSRNSEFSPRKAAGVRHFSEIAATTSPDGSGQTQADVDAVMNDIMTVEDQTHMAAVADHPKPKTRKRRKLVDQHLMNEAALPDATSDLSDEQEEVNLEIQQGAAEQAHVNTENSVAQPFPTSALRASPSKANELGPPVAANDKTPIRTPESVRVHEAAGAKAVSQLLSGRTTRAVKKSKGKPRYQTAARSGEVRPDRSKARPSVQPIPVAPIQNDNGNIGLDPQVLAEQALDPAQPTAADKLDQMANETETEEQTRDRSSAVTISAPERIFALFKGQYNQFFPATWLGSSSEKQTHRIRFDDTTTTNIEMQHVCALDLRVGDVVKVDDPNMRKGTWVIVGFGDVALTAEERALGVDVRGRSRVLVEAKTSRNSTTGDDVGAQSASGKTHEVLVTNIYITHTMWKLYSGRAFVSPLAWRASGVGREATPSTRPQSPNADNTGSRTRRSGISNLQGTHAQSGFGREGSVASSHGTKDGGIFRGMAFAVSCTGREEHKRAEITHLIREHGGIVLETGFIELFDTPGSDSVKVTPSKKATRPKKAQDERSSLQIKPEFEDLGFVALIADSHNRKAKYMQALALGLPTLSIRWITDCLDAAKSIAHGEDGVDPICWSKYLLPAGESSYLNGAIRSRTLTPHDVASVQFSTTVSSRPRILNSEGVLIFPGKSKSSRDNRDMFAFLALALGARCVKRVANFKEATTLLEQQTETWTWVSVDGSVGEAATALLGDDTAGGPAGGSKKKKRGPAHGKRETKMSATDGRVTIVNDEFVIQSLILGDLIE